MADEKVILEALGSSDFKVSVKDKKHLDELETETVYDIKRQLGEDPPSKPANPNDGKSLVNIFKNMSESQRQKVIELLKHNGINDPLTKEKIIQNSFTIEKIIRNNASN